MRSVGVISRGSDHVFVVNITGRNIKLNIFKPNTINPFELIRTGKYNKEDILYSVIYSKFFKVSYVYGMDFVLVDGLSILNSLDKYALLHNGNIPTAETESIKIRPYSNFIQGGNSTKESGLEYRKPDSPLYLMSQEITYNIDKSSDIKTLDYFKETKNLNLDKKDYRCLDTYEKIEQYVQEVKSSEELYQAWDTETTGLNFFKDYDNDEIVGMSHSYRDLQGVYIPFLYMGDHVLDVKVAYDLFKPIINEKKNIFQNASFDKRVFWNYGLDFPVDIELTIVLHIINSQKTKSKALKPVAKILLGEDTIELDEILGKNFDPKRIPYIPLDLITVYACGDTDYTRRCAIKLMDKLTHTEKNLLKFDMECYKIVIDADWVGVPADQEYLTSLLNNSKQDLIEMENFILDYIYTQCKFIELERILSRKNKTLKDISEKDIKRLMETDDFKKIIERKCKGTRRPILEIGYTQDKRKILYDLLGYPKLVYTNTGELSVGEEYFNNLLVYELDQSSEIMTSDLLSTDGKQVLISASEVNKYAFPLAYMLQQYSSQLNRVKIYTRLNKTYSNGYTHSTYKFCGTETGRLTNAIQTIPKYAKKAIGFSKESKYGMIVFDFDQIELRGIHNEAIRMWESMKELPEVKNNPQSIINTYDWRNVAEIFNSFDKDVHTEMTAAFNHVLPRDVTPEMRSKGKKGNFAGAYGSTARNMAKDDLKKAKTAEERERIIKSYEDTLSSILVTNMHLMNYFDITKEMGLIPIPESEIPFNILSKNVGKVTGRSGRSRYFELDNLTSKARARIQNQSRNNYAQSYCRDIYFHALLNLTTALRKEGLTRDEIVSVIFVHDEDGMVYDKSKINPLWLAAMVYKYCCVELEGSPIKYYCTPAICSNWEEGKSDKYEIPKEFLKSLPTERDKYPLVTEDHVQYTLRYITDFYIQKVYDIAMKYAHGDVLSLEDIDLDNNYYYLGKAKMYTKNLKGITGNKVLDVIINLLKQHPNCGNITLTYHGETIDMGNVFNTDTGDISDDIDTNLIFLDDEEDLLDFEFDDDSSHISEANVLTSSINRKTLDELDNKFINTSKENDDYITKNIMYEKYMGRVTIYLDSVDGKRIPTLQCQEIYEMLKKCSSEFGIKVNLIKAGKLYSPPLKVPMTFKFDKFDKYVESMRR